MQIRALLIGCILTAASSVTFANAPDSALSQFLAGAKIIQSANLDSLQKALQFRRLEKAAGLSALQARSRIKSYRNKPEKWQKVQDNVLEILDSSRGNDTTKISK
ncbi:MAG: hypothetical protein GF398_21305 [Chitinivibrionales bacterium]|nr:hypothetical protein [Chitinivibrionales bacterium]